MSKTKALTSGKLGSEWQKSSFCPGMSKWLNSVCKAATAASSAQDWQPDWPFQGPATVAHTLPLWHARGRGWPERIAQLACGQKLNSFTRVVLSVQSLDETVGKCCPVLQMSIKYQPVEMVIGTQPILTVSLPRYFLIERVYCQMLTSSAINQIFTESEEH